MPTPLIVFVITEDEFAQTLEAGIERLTVIGLGELLYEVHQIRIAGDHKGGHRNVELTATLSQVERTPQDGPIDPKAVFIVFLTLFDAGGLTVGDRKDLFVGIPATAQQIHCQF